MALLIDMGGDWVKAGTKIRCRRSWDTDNPVTGKPFKIPVGTEASILRFGPGEVEHPKLASVFVGSDAYSGDVILGWFEFGNGGQSGYITQMRGDFVNNWEPIGDAATAKSRPQRSMFAKCHPDQRGAVTDKIFIGYWAQSSDPDADRYAQKGLPLPWPADFVDTSWDAAERDRVVRYLRAAPKVEHWMGSSGCRFGCTLHNGASDQGDGKYVWPEGFAHYVEAHNVRPPEEFLEHVRRSSV